jgi:hypothetical protein
MAVPLLDVRRELARAGIEGREEQDALIKSARGKTVSGVAFEGRGGIDPQEWEAGILEREGETPIGYLNLLEGEAPTQTPTPTPKVPQAQEARPAPAAAPVPKPPPKVDPKVEAAFGYEPDQWLTIKQLAQATGMKPPQLAANLNALRQQDRLQSKTRGGRDVYQLKEPGQESPWEEGLKIASQEQSTPAPKSTLPVARETVQEEPVPATVPKEPKKRGRKPRLETEEEALKEHKTPKFPIEVLAVQLSRFARKRAESAKGEGILSLRDAREFLETMGLSPEQMEKVIDRAVEADLLRRPYKGQPQDYLEPGGLGVEKKKQEKGPQTPEPREPRRGRIARSREDYAAQLMHCQEEAMLRGDRASALIYQRERLALNGKP